jgi:hypothetical protein
VVVTGAAQAQGAAIGNPQPEAQFGPAEIQSYGVSTLDDLLTALTPQTISGAGNGPPIVLLNGRRISGREEIEDIPSEAILRVDVLPEEESLAYGFPPDQKVVNFLLRPSFDATTAELTGSRPTEGGEDSGSADFNRFEVEKDDRLNFDLKYSANSALREAARDLAPVPTSPPYDLLGNVVAPSPGQEIDPALSALAGAPVSVAGVPANLGARAPTLADFVSTAGQANLSGDHPYRTLLPANQALSGNAVWSRAFGDRTSATLNATFRLNDSQSLRGLAGIGLTVPSGDPFSPFASDVVLDRYLPDTLHQESHSWTGHLGGTLNRDIDLWRFSLTGAYDHGYSRTVSDSGVDTEQAQALLLALSPSFDPFGPPSASLFPRTAPNIAQSLTDSANIQLVAEGPLADLPAGPLSSSFTVGDTGNWIDSHSQGTSLSSLRLDRNDISARGDLELPLTSRDRNVLGAIGNLSLNGNAALDALSDYGVLSSWGYGARWSPLEDMTLSVNVTHSQSAPSPGQLGNPVVTATGGLLFDFATGQAIAVTSIGGGNANLASSRQRRFRVGLIYKPFQNPRITVAGNYVDSQVSNPIGSLPAATAEVEAALPDRFIRDADGQLVTIDSRPLNFASQGTRQFRWGFNGSGTIADWLGTASSEPPKPGWNRIVVSLYHTVFFEDRILLSAGEPALDLLDGGATGSRGGQARHQIDGDLGFTNGTLGAHVSATWKSGTTILGGGAPAGDLGFSGLATVSLRLFANIDEMETVLQHLPWLEGTRITFSATNLLDQRVRVMDGNGQIPPSYQPAYLDPAGRLVSLSLRKQFP